MKCDYCDKESEILIKEHFFPRKSGGKNNPENIFKACNTCNLRKGSFIFWSLDSLREYISIKQHQPHYSYGTWIKHKLMKCISHKDLAILKLLFDRDIEIEKWKENRNGKQRADRV